MALWEYNGMPYIQLSQNKQTLVDVEDFDRLNQNNWYVVHRGTKKLRYAVRSVRGQGKDIRYYMHREIIGLKSGNKQRVDHINHNGLDNRRCNLRLCTVSENLMNQREQKGASSQFKGVYWDKERQKWDARIKLNGKQHYLGRFDSELEAGTAYNKAA